MALSPTICPSCNTPNRAGSAFCNNCGSPLTGGGSPSGPTGRLASGQMLKQRYRIIQIVGQGGMGAVYKAEETPLGNRLVAMKEMSQSGLSQQEVKEAADAFKQEAIILGRLTHPNLPSIFDHFEENGRWYLVMSFIQGETLADYLSKTKEGKIPLDEALQIGIQLSTVLDYLHNQQPSIIFRDLKSANIMRTPSGHIYLIDFGIARHFKPGQAKDTIPFGSAGFAAPEQYGKAQTTPQSDIYSLGALLHQLISGHDPSTNTPNPYTFPPLPKVSAELERLIEQMLQMNTTNRPASMAAVKQELERIADQRRHPSPVPPTTPAPPTIPTPVIIRAPQNKGVTRRNVIIGLIVLVVVGVIVTVASNIPKPVPTPVPTPTQPFSTIPTPVPTPSVTWIVNYDYYENALALKNGYQVNDPVNHHFIVVHLTFTNNTSQAQELQTGQDFYLQGSDGQRYYEDQASNPSNILQFAPGETQHVYTAYVVPDSVCNYTLVVANPGGQDLTWSITVTDSNYCHT